MPSLFIVLPEEYKKNSEISAPSNYNPNFDSKVGAM